MNTSSFSTRTTKTGRAHMITDRKPPSEAIIQSCCPTRKCKKPLGHDGECGRR